MAVADNHEKIARILIDHGADVNQADLLRRTPLDGALISRNANLIQLLIDNGAKIQPCENILDKAVSLNDKKLVKALIDAGVDLFSSAEVNKFVLDPLATPGPTEIISTILEDQKKAPIPPKSCFVTFTQKDDN